MGHSCITQNFNEQDYESIDMRIIIKLDEFKKQYTLVLVDVMFHPCLLRIVYHVLLTREGYATPSGISSITL